MIKNWGKRKLRFEKLEKREVLSAVISNSFIAPPNPDADVDEFSPEPVAVFPGVTVERDAILTHHDVIPRFANLAGSAIAYSVRSGFWSDPAVWSNGVVPDDDARVQVVTGTVVVYDVQSAARIDAVEVHGFLAFASGKDTRLIIDALMIMPNGTLTIGTDQLPIASNYTAEIIFRGDTALQTGTIEEPGIDPHQFGKGLIAFGRVTIHGRQIDEPFVRLSEDASSGDVTIKVGQGNLGWRVGDSIIIPDTRQIARSTIKPVFQSQAEKRVLADVFTAGPLPLVVLSDPLQFDHAGPRDATGNVGEIEMAMMPHVGNLTRNVIIRSENPDEILRRGHVMFSTHADVDVRYAAFQGLGRTTSSIRRPATEEPFSENQKGRYSVHFHHVAGRDNHEDTGYQGKLIGSVIDDFLKWGVTLHDTHYMQIEGNIAYAGRGNTVSTYDGLSGAAFATEGGNESYNVFDSNFVVHTGAGDSQRILGTAGIGGIFRDDSISRDGFWFRGPNNYVRNNVVANAPDFAYNYNGERLWAVMKVPNFRGADLTDPSQYTAWNPTRVRDDAGNIIGTVEGLPILESTGNEAYGATGQGLWIQRPQGHTDKIEFYSDQPSIFRDYKIWHVSDAGVYDWGEDSRSKFYGFVMRNDPAVSAMSIGNYTTGMSFGDTYYSTSFIEIRQFDIQGFNIGIQLPHRPEDMDASTEDVTYLENGILRNHVNIEDRYSRWSEKTTEVHNVSFSLTRAPVTNQTIKLGQEPIPSEPANIWMHPDISDAHTEAMSQSRLLVYGFNKEPGNDFEVYFADQARGAIVKPYRTSRGSGIRDDAPGVGMLVQDAWDTFGIAPGGAVAPSQAVDRDDGLAAELRAEAVGIVGLLFPMAPAASPEAVQSDPFRGTVRRIGVGISPTRKVDAMAYPTDSLAVTLGDIDRLLIRLKSYVTTTAADFATGATAHEIVAVRFNLISAKTTLNSLKTAPGLAAYAKIEKDDDNLDVVAEFNAVLSAIDAATANIELTFPADGDGYLLREKFAASGDTTPRQFASGAVATLKGLLETLAGTID